MVQRVLRFAASVAAVAAVTFVAFELLPVNAATVGFAYILLILVIASTWGFAEAAVSSVLATVLFNYYFFPPVSTFTIADPQNWVALVSFLVSSLMASRLSTKAKRRALDALERQQDLERLYTFSRAILLSDAGEPFPSQLVRKLTETFGFSDAVLYERRTGACFRAGVSGLEGVEDQLRDAALHGTTQSALPGDRTITAIRLGSEPIASLALLGMPVADSVAQGIANLVAIGLERDRAQELAHRVEAERQSEQLRTTLIDAMAHEFKTPLTLIKGATTSVLAGCGPLPEPAREQLTIADEEADHLRELLDNAIEMARLDTQDFEIDLETLDLREVARDVIASMRVQIDGRPIAVEAAEQISPVAADRRLLMLALKQLLDNALKYGSADGVVAIRIHGAGNDIRMEVVDHGRGIAPDVQVRIFERFYRGERDRNQVPGFGIGLNIARGIMLAHAGELTVSSVPGETIFRLVLPLTRDGGAGK